MTIAQLGKKYYTVPTCWNELSKKQLIKVMQVLYGGATMIAAQIMLLKILTGISWYRMQLISASHFEEKLYLTDFLLEHNTLTQNLIPKYKGFFGPSSEFANVQVCEFIFAEQYYRHYRDSERDDPKSISHLNMLIATLYRPVKKNYNVHINPDGDVREIYNDNLTGLYAAKIGRWPAAIKMAILQWFEGCLIGLERDFRPVFQGSGDAVSKYGLWSVMRSVAEKGVHGNISQVEKMYVRVFMMELVEIKAEAARHEEMARKKKLKNG